MNEIKQKTERLVSLDVFRGITMLLLIAEAALVYEVFNPAVGHASFAGFLVKQFHHHPWNGLRFWDLIQPFFMFIVGVAMPFSLANRMKKGSSYGDAYKHIIKRCFILLLLGVGLHCVYSHKLVWELWNVLTQLSFTILVAFSIIRLSLRNQFFVSIGLLAIAELTYRIYDPSTPFVKDQNFGSWMDLILMGKINNGGGWVTVNCISTAAHTIWGVICGKILMSEKTLNEKIVFFVKAALVGFVLGYGLDLAGITPIIKRIATTSFVLASGGWCLLALAFNYWIVDIKGYKKWAFPFIIVGMNPIFIYIFSETIGKEWWPIFIGIFNDGILGKLGFSLSTLETSSSFVVLASFWYLCYFLYKKNVFIKI